MLGMVVVGVGGRSWVLLASPEQCVNEA